MFFTEKVYKLYVRVIARFDTDGSVTPLTLVWEDGKSYKIDRVTDRRRAASLKAGGIGIRYTCVIEGKERFLFLEENKWFVEKNGR